LEYDDVLNQQREIIYRQRRAALRGELRDTISGMLDDLVNRTVEALIPEKTYPEEWDVDSLKLAIEELFPLGDVNPEDWRELTREGIKDDLRNIGQQALVEREQELGTEIFRDLERVIVLRMVDSKWMSHLDDMEELRQGIGLRAYGQRDPLVEYKLEAYDMFQHMIEEIKQDVIRYLFKVQVVTQPTARSTATIRATSAPQPVTGDVETKSVGRNDPCPCGSGKKFKKCCGKDA